MRYLCLLIGEPGIDGPVPGTPGRFWRLDPGLGPRYGFAG